MPWYFRTLGSWHRDLKTAGWRVDELSEPFDPKQKRYPITKLECPLVSRDSVAAPKSRKNR